MGCLGVLFALTEADVNTLKSYTNDDDLLDYFQEELEEQYFNEQPELTAQMDKSWDAMHRLLSDGALSYKTGPEPLRLVVIGGEQIYFKDNYIMSLKTPAQVKAIASAIADISKEFFKQRYGKMDQKKYEYPKSDEDFEYAWAYFGDVVALYNKAAAENRYVLFTASQ